MMNQEELIEEAITELFAKPYDYTEARRILNELINSSSQDETPKVITNEKQRNLCVHRNKCTLRTKIYNCRQTTVCFEPEA